MESLFSRAVLELGNHLGSFHSVKDTSPRLHDSSLLLKASAVHLGHVVLSIEVELCQQEVFEAFKRQVRVRYAALQTMPLFRRLPGIKVLSDVGPDIPRLFRRTYAFKPKVRTDLRPLCGEGLGLASVGDVEAFALGIFWKR